jgi:hypothetical protein
MKSSKVRFVLMKCSLEIHVEFNDGGLTPCDVKFTKVLPYKQIAKRRGDGSN